MPFNSDERLNQPFADFKHASIFYSNFKLEFEGEIFDVILDFYPYFDQKGILNDMIDYYCTEILGATESTLNKDKNDSEQKMQVELEYLNTILGRERIITTESDFSDTLHNKIKELIVKHYPNIVELSNYGFRLLERHLKLYLFGFVSQFISFVK